MKNFFVAITIFHIMATSGTIAQTTNRNMNRTTNGQGVRTNEIQTTSISIATTVNEATTKQSTTTVDNSNNQPETTSESTTSAKQPITTSNIVTTVKDTTTTIKPTSTAETTKLPTTETKPEASPTTSVAMSTTISTDVSRENTSTKQNIATTSDITSTGKSTSGHTLSTEDSTDPSASMTDDGSATTTSSNGSGQIFTPVMISGICLGALGFLLLVVLLVLLLVKRFRKPQQDIILTDLQLIGTIKPIDVFNHERTNSIQKETSFKWDLVHKVDHAASKVDDDGYEDIRLDLSPVKNGNDDKDCDLKTNTMRHNRSHPVTLSSFKQEKQD